MFSRYAPLSRSAHLSSDDRPQARFSLGWAVVLLVSFVSCRHSHDARAQGTSAQIVHAIEALRLAANPEKGAWLSRLQKLPCQTEDVCELKTLCVHAYETHLGGFEQVRQATSIIGDADAGDARDTPDASAELMLNAMAKAQNGQRQLKAARRQTRACAENEAVIRQRYRL